MRVKKHPSGNEFILAGDVLVRNFTKFTVAPTQLTNMFSKDDYNVVMRNQELNKNHPKIADEVIRFNDVVIVSDGYDFENRHLFLTNLPRSVAIIAVNKAVNKWGLLSPEIAPEDRRVVNAYVVNNPYKECMTYMPPKSLNYFPTCIASIRTNHEFLKKYPGNVYTYMPTPDKTFGTDIKDGYCIDDYRNPICAAIGLAYRWEAKRIMLVCCDDSFEEKRDFAVQLDNGLYTYPHHIKSKEIIDANLYWLTHQEDKEVKVADFSSGPKYANTAYISSEEDALDFFRDQEEGTPNVT